MPKVSVIIPAYNHGHFLGEAVQSVLDQTFPDFELIVVDDGSTDNTKEAVESFKDPRIRYIYQENRGVSAAQNTGIRASSGEYIAILGADDIWLPQNLELKVKVLDSRPEVALVCSDGFIFDDTTGVTLGSMWHLYSPGLNPRRAARQPLRELLSRASIFIRPQFTVLRREVFTEVGYFDESLRIGEDWEMFIRIVQCFPIEILDVPLGWRRKHGAALTASRVETYPEVLRTFDKVLRNRSLSGTDISLVKRELAHTHSSYGWEMILNGRTNVGRKKLIASIKVNPWCVRPYIYLVLSLLGTRLVLTIRAWNKQFRRCGRSQSSGSVQSING
jgi:glycosyltransferase involved in cell wall biosynthesis